jgi:actin-related protein 5
MTEIIFECYSAPSLTYGIDSLFSYNYNGGKTGLVVSSSNSATHIIPVLNSKPLLNHATRLNWGGSQNAEFLLKLMNLKYPTFPGKLTSQQAERLVREHSYISQDFPAELSKFMDWTGLEDRDHVIQFPYVEHVVVEKSQDELDKIAEKRKESGRRLQAQAAKMRLEKVSSESLFTRLSDHLDAIRAILRLMLSTLITTFRFKYLHEFMSFQEESLSKTKQS